MVAFQELDDRVPFAQQLGEKAEPIVFINTFHVAPEDVDEFMAAWTNDGEIMQKQPGYISTQLHRGIGGSTTFVNVAEWESLDAMRNAVSSADSRLASDATPRAPWPHRTSSPRWRCPASARTDTQCFAQNHHGAMRTSPAPRVSSTWPRGWWGYSSRHPRRARPRRTRRSKRSSPRTTGQRSARHSLSTASPVLHSRCSSSRSRDGLRSPLTACARSLSPQGSRQHLSRSPKSDSRSRSTGISPAMARHTRRRRYSMP